MKKLFTTKKKIFMVCLAFLLTTIGISYAWFTAKVNVEQTIKMGSLNISANFTPLSDDEVIGYEPGGNAEVTGVISNTGSLPTFVKIVNDSKIKFKYDGDGNAISSENQTFEDMDPNAIQMSFTPTSGKYDDIEGAYWFEDGAKNKYVLLDSGASVHVTVNADFDGPSMDNRYQESEIKVGSQLSATQVMEGAMKDVLNVQLDELVGMSDSTTRSARSYAAVNNRAMQRLNEILEKNSKSK
ncbi:hypothetical protein [Enterococcus camelliae]|uniref:Camelysin metallo-endopeptidase n=1 Tax=Enterococcus camelliae TaxID=453959 RepID=A0ABW5TGF1_9ENTE